MVSKRGLAGVILALAVCGGGDSALAQGSLLQGGKASIRHVPMYTGPSSAATVLGDSGAANGTCPGGSVGCGLGELLQINQGLGTGPDGSHSCDYDAAPGTSPYFFLCFDANLKGQGPTIVAGSGGGAPPVTSLKCDINGVIAPCTGPPGPQGPPAPGIFDVAKFGALGNGVTDDSTSIAAAFTACSTALGGTVLFRPTGSLYVISQANLITAANTAGCSWQGTGGHFWPANFYDNTPAHWAAKGAWIWCQDTTNACAELSAPGQSVNGLNWWYTQPTPSSTTCSAQPCLFVAGWTPTTYPPTIKVDPTANFYHIDDNMIVNAYQCLDVEGPANGVANMYSSITNNGFGCFAKDARLSLVDNTLVWHANHDFLLWYQGSVQVLTYVESIGGIGIDAQYVANLIMDDSEFVWKRTAILLTDGSVTSGFGTLTFAGANWQLTNIQFNEVCQAFDVANSTTHFNGGPAGNAIGRNQLTNILATVDTSTSGIPAGGSAQCAALTHSLFRFASDNVAVMFTNLNIGFADIVLTIGGGSSGYAGITTTATQAYSVYTAGLPAFKANTNAVLEIQGSPYTTLPGNGSAGPFTQGGILAPTGFGNLQVAGQPGSPRMLSFGSSLSGPGAADFGSSYRWQVRTDGSVESGSNAGSNLFVDRFNDAGVFVDSPLAINRATGLTSIADGLKVSPLPGAPPSGIGSGYLCLDNAGQAYLKVSCP